MHEDAPLDPRIHAFRPDLADARLRGRVEAQAFAEGSLKRVVAGLAPLKRNPLDHAPLDSEVIRGEVVRVFGDTADGWSFCQGESDGYVGFVPTEVLGDLAPAPTHRVTALQTFLYPAPDLKLPPLVKLAIGSEVTVEDEARTRGTRYVVLAGGEGALVATHVEPVEAARPDDFVALADRFVETPYRWGGRSGFGVDCSGFVQLVLGLSGRRAPRDTDLQASGLGQAVDGGIEGDLRRGDIVIWTGHALIVRGDDTVIHSSGHHMKVVVEPMAEAFRRLLSGVGQPLAVRRVV